jgi:hypothetical protein
MKISGLSVVIFVLVSPMMAATPSGTVYSVRRDQIVVSSSIPLANAEKWATPTLSHSKLSAQGAGIGCGMGRWPVSTCAGRIL